MDIVHPFLDDDLVIMTLQLLLGLRCPWGFEGRNELQKLHNKPACNPRHRTLGGYDGRLREERCDKDDVSDVTTRDISGLLLSRGQPVIATSGGLGLARRGPRFKK